MSYNSTSIGYELLFFYGYFVSWFVPLLIVCGSVGTVLSIVVLLRRRTTQPEIRCWFLVLSSNDLTGILCGLLTLYMSRLHLITSLHYLQIDIKAGNRILCYVNTNVIFFSLLLSSWLQAGISVLRAVSTLQPLKMRSKITTSSARIYLLLLIASALTLSLVLVNFTIEYSEVHLNNSSKGYRCRLKRTYQDTFYFVSLIARVVIPVTLLVGSSILICESLKRQSNESRSSRILKRKPNDVDQHGGNQRGHPPSNHRNISCMLLLMNLSFLLSNLPFEMFKLFYRNYDIMTIKSKSDIQFFIYTRIADKFLNILVYLNQSTNWLFYFMLGKKFRNELMTLCDRKRQHLHFGDASSFKVNNCDLSVTNSVKWNKKMLTNQSTLEKYSEMYKRSKS